MLYGVIPAFEPGSSVHVLLSGSLIKSGMTFYYRIFFYKTKILAYKNLFLMQFQKVQRQK